jgi:preprotein translocase subunit SecF
MAREGHESIATRLYRGEISWDFIGRRRWWYALSGLVMIIGIVSLGVRGLNPSIDFKGGAEFSGPIHHFSINDVTDAVSSVGVTPESHQTTGNGQFQVETATLTPDQVINVENALVEKLHITDRGDLSVSTVGSTWGSQITNKAIEGLVIFLIAVILYLSVRFEWKMALAAIIALIHDLVITAGIYSLAGLQVSPSTVIALLTILGYSLYDTVVVFDKVRENTVGITGGSKMTFTQAANLAVNQTLVRSINTSVIALLPVLGLLVIGVGLLGAGSLDDLSFALFIGLASGAYSSIFIATPLLCEFKEREETYKALARRVAQRRARGIQEGTLVPATAGATIEAYNSTVAADDVVGERAPREGVAPRPGARPPHSQRKRAQGGRPGGRGGKSKKRR